MFTRPRQTTGSRPEPVLQRKDQTYAGGDEPSETDVRRLTPLRGWARRRTGGEAEADASLAPGPVSAATGRRRATEPPLVLVQTLPDDEPPLRAPTLAPPQVDARQPAVDSTSSGHSSDTEQTAAYEPPGHIEADAPGTERAPIDLPEAPAPIASAAEAAPAEMQPPPESAAPELSETAPAEQRSEPVPMASAPMAAIEAQADAPPEAGSAIGADLNPSDPDPEQTSGAAESQAAATAEDAPPPAERRQAETETGIGAPGGTAAEQVEPSGTDPDPVDESVIAEAAEPDRVEAATPGPDPSPFAGPEILDATESPAAGQTQDDDAALEARVLAEVTRELEHRANRAAVAPENAPASVQEQPGPVLAAEAPQAADRAELREIVREILREEMQASLAAEIDRRVQSVVADRLMQAFAPRSEG